MSPKFRAPARMAAVLAVAVPMLAVAPAAGAVTLTGSGSSAAQPYMLDLFRGYSQTHRGVHFKYVPDGGNAGVKDVQQGRVQFAINTRPPLPSDSGTTYAKLFLDALCIGVNKSNSISSIGLSELKNVFLGVDTTWSQVPGSNLSSTIDPVGRTSSAGLYTFFQQSVLGGATQSSNVQQETADGLVQTKVQSDPNAIGYVGLAHSTGGSEKAIAVNGVPCQARYIRNESYPLFRYDWGVVPTGHVSASGGEVLQLGPLSAIRPARSSTAPVRWPPSTSSPGTRLSACTTTTSTAPSRSRSELTGGLSWGSARWSCRGRRRPAGHAGVHLHPGVAVVRAQRVELVRPREQRRHPDLRPSSPPVTCAQAATS